jgi:hypothetical protein
MILAMSKAACSLLLRYMLRVKGLCSTGRIFPECCWKSLLVIDFKDLYFRFVKLDELHGLLFRGRFRLARSLRKDSRQSFIRFIKKGDRS